MKKTALMSLAILSLISFAFTPPNTTPTANKDKDKAATKLLKEVSKKYKSYKTLKAEFSVSTEASDPKSPAKKAEKGTLMSKGSNFKLIFGGQEIFCNGKYIWTYTKDMNECVKDNYNPNSNGGINPSKIFTIWEKGFLYASDGTNKNNAKIKLTPTDKTKPYFLMNLEVDQTTKTVQNLKVSYKAGHKQIYTIISQTPNTAMDDKLFVFDPAAYPGVEMIDLTKKK